MFATKLKCVFVWLAKSKLFIRLAPTKLRPGASEKAQKLVSIPSKIMPIGALSVALWLFYSGIRILSHVNDRNITYTNVYK